MPGLLPPPPPDPAFEHLYIQEEADGEPEAPEMTGADEFQAMINNLTSVANLRKAEDDQLDACVMASVALSMDELARIDDLPETDLQHYAEIQKDILHAMSTQPVAFAALLQAMADSALKNSPNPLENIESRPVSHLLVDVSSDDLSPFVTLRREHQTEEARKGVRTYKSSETFTKPKSGAVKPLSERQILARQMQAIISQDQLRGVSSGLNRKVRWTGFGEASSTREDTGVAKAKTGNIRKILLLESVRI
ncbi:hypothetical protein DFH07DRAFT_959908 [Mycena maculata]|uniref:Uncharacterized protein n=1 Tax=Mycena maculata TaxID=230809 RepID=A0AAD7NC95_9AGAR|nr:hypothetical protein DFH07DRAFT_959908 [Mycena maculata]